jgi:hypothetical protein
MIYDTDLKKGTPIKVVKGLQKGQTGVYSHKQNNSNWYVINLGGGNDEYYVNLEEIEIVGPISKCCSAAVKVGGESTTHYFICNSCGKACDIKAV